MFALRCHTEPAGPDKRKISRMWKGRARWLFEKTVVSRRAALQCGWKATNFAQDFGYGTVRLKKGGLQSGSFVDRLRRSALFLSVQ